MQPYLVIILDLSFTCSNYKISRQNRQLNNIRVAPLVYYEQLNVESLQDKFPFVYFSFPPF